MDDRNEDARRRILLQAAEKSDDEWASTIGTFYRTLQSHHPNLAAYFVKTDIDFLVRKLVAILVRVARDMPDQDALDRILFHTGCAHVARGIGRPEFADFIALLANVLADGANPTERETAHNVWYQELVIVVDTMLLTAPP